MCVCVCVCSLNPVAIYRIPRLFKISEQISI